MDATQSVLTISWDSVWWHLIPWFKETHRISKVLHCPRHRPLENWSRNVYYVIAYNSYPEQNKKVRRTSLYSMLWTPMNQPQKDIPLLIAFHTNKERNQGCRSFHNHVYQNKYKFGHQKNAEVETNKNRRERNRLPKRNNTTQLNLKENIVIFTI